MSVEPQLPDDCPPYPSIVLGKGQWMRVMKALQLRNTKADDVLLSRIVSDLSRTAAMHPYRPILKKGGKGK